jgi:hypothetical protein
MGMVISYGDTSSEVRKNRKPDRKCDKCANKIEQKEYYVHSVLFPAPWDGWDFTVRNWCFSCLPQGLWSMIHKKMCGE